MKNNTDFSDAEVYELEKLCLEKFQQFKFEPIDYDTKENIVIIKNPEFESLVNTFYKGRYSKDQNGNIKMSFYIFSLLEHRFFPNNNSKPISGTYYYDSSETKYTHRTFNGKDVSNNSEYDEVFSKFDNHFKK